MKNSILIIAGIVAIMVVYYVNPTEEQTESLHLDQKPDFFMEDFTQRNTNQQGIFNQTISGDKIDIFDQKGYSLLRSPFITVIKKDGLEFKLQAANGQMFNRDKIFLSGGVAAVNSVLKSVETLKTETLWVYPNINFAETDKPVSIKRNLSTSKGTGAKFYIDTNKLELLSDATTIYNVK